MKKVIFLSILSVTLLLACASAQLLSGDIEVATQSPGQLPAESTADDFQDESIDGSFIFPLPEDAGGIDERGSQSIQFETNLSLNETVEYYRLELSALGLVETNAKVVEDWGGRLFFEDPASELEIWVSISPAGVMFTPIEKSSFVFLAVLSDRIAPSSLTSIGLEYPFPEDAEVIDERDNLFQFATDLPLGEVAEFYRQEFAALGLLEMKDTLTEEFRGMILFGDPNREQQITVGLAPASASPTAMEKVTIVTLIMPGAAPTPRPSFFDENAYPLPPDAEVTYDWVDTIKFGTDLSLDELVAFYRLELGALGMAAPQFNMDQVWGGTMFFNDSSGRPALIIAMVPADKAPEETTEKATFVALIIP